MVFTRKCIRKSTILEIVSSFAPNRISILDPLNVAANMAGRLRSRYVCPPPLSPLREAETWTLNLGMQMMRYTGVMATTTTATDCEWSFLGAAEAPEAALVGSEGRREADTDPHPDAQSTGSLCQVNTTCFTSAHYLSFQNGAYLYV